MTNPTNTITPAAAVAVAANTVTAATSPKRVSLRLIPRPAATSSPRARGGKWRAKAISSTTPTANPPAVIATGVHEATSTEPVTHARIRAKECGSTRMRAEESPSHTAPMATPARISLSGSTSPALPRPTAVTSSMVTAAPMMAASEKAKGDCHPHQPRAMAAAKLAPTLIPKTPVSAKGLRVIICRTAPARAKAQPAQTATRVRGSRLSHTIEEAIPG